MTAAREGQPHALRHREADLGEVRLHYVETGPRDGPLVVLLHGFPEFWFGWRRQLPALAAAGCHAVAPDLRGYNRSDKPPGLAAYDMACLTQDVERLIRACGAERAVVVGHDWDGIIAWWFAMRYPAMVERLVILNAPHPAALGRTVLSPLQWLRGAYVGFFQLPGLPEALLAANDFAALRWLFRTDPRRRAAFSEQDIACYVAAFARPGALTSALNCYRAALQRPLSMSGAGLRRIDQPVLVVWGEQDGALGPELAEPDHYWVPHVRLVRLPEASHWVQHDQPRRVNALLLEEVAAGG